MPEVQPFDETASDLSKITVTCDESTGELTISGVDQREFRAILNAAFLHRVGEDKPTYISPDETDREIAEANAADHQAWRYAQSDLIGYLSDAIVASFHKTAPDPLAKIKCARMTRNLDPEPAWTDVAPPRNPVADQRARVSKLIQAAQDSLSAAARANNL